MADSSEEFVSESCLRVREKKNGLLEVIENERQRIAELDAADLRGDDVSEPTEEELETYMKHSNRLKELQNAMELLRMEGDEFLGMITARNPFIPPSMGVIIRARNPPMYLVKVNNHGQLLFYRAPIPPSTDFQSRKNSDSNHHSQAKSLSRRSTSNNAPNSTSSHPKHSNHQDIQAQNVNRVDQKTDRAPLIHNEPNGNAKNGNSQKEPPLTNEQDSQKHHTTSSAVSNSRSRGYAMKKKASDLSESQLPDYISFSDYSSGSSDRNSGSLSDNEISSTDSSITAGKREVVDGYEPRRRSSSRRSASRKKQKPLATFFTASTFESPDGNIVSKNAVVAVPVRGPRHDTLSTSLTAGLSESTENVPDFIPRRPKLRLRAYYSIDQILGIKLGAMSAPPSRTQSVVVSVCDSEIDGTPMMIEIQCSPHAASEMTEVVGAHIKQFNKSKISQARQMNWYSSLVTTPYNKKNKQHEAMLFELWDHSFPGIKLKSRVSKQWQSLGFQGKDPATDFRALGVFGLYCLVYFSRNSQALSQTLVAKRANLPLDQSYPFAIAGINIAHMLLTMIGKKGLNDKLVQLPACDSSWNSLLFAFLCVIGGDHGTDAFMEVYSCCVEVLDVLFDQMNGTYMEFNAILQVLHERLVEALSCRPPTIQGLRQLLLA